MSPKNQKYSTDSFRSSLRNIVLKTLPVLAATSSLAVGCNTIIVLPNEKTINTEARGEISKEGRPGERIVKDEMHRPDEPPRPDETKRPDVDAGEPQRPDLQKNEILIRDERYPDSNRLSCPENPETFKKECGKQYEGKLNTALPLDAPQPLSYKDCVALCNKQVKDTCVGLWSTDDYFRTELQINACVEGIEGNQRRMLCDYKMSIQCLGGRMPSGFEEKTIQFEVDEGEFATVGRFFSEMSYMEDAAVTAFRYLAKELEAYNAPDFMVEWAREGVREEVEHVGLTRRLARRFGGHPPKAEVEPFVLRSLAEIAYENAREGCVRETFGSLVAYWQAANAKDSAVQAVMERIAHEESKHGALSWAIAEWILPQLSEEEQQKALEIQKTSIELLKEEILEETPQILVDVAGYPTAAQSQQLLDALQQEQAGWFA